MECWICGAEATTGEHMTKASDLRSLFGPRSQQNPLFLHTHRKLNQRVPGINSGKLKSKALICAFCNNERTQPHDRAWEALSTYLRRRQPPIRPGTFVNLSSVFPGKTHKSMLYIHLFFLKLFGCLIVEHSIPIDIRKFSTSILHGNAHPMVHLKFAAISNPHHHKFAGRSQVQTAKVGERVVYAVWLYDIGSISVHVIYSEPSEHRKGLLKSWHPSSISKLIQIVAE